MTSQLELSFDAAQPIRVGSLPSPLSPYEIEALERTYSPERWDKGQIRRPAKIGGRLYLMLGAVYYGPKRSRTTVAEVIPEGNWTGPTHSYSEALAGYNDGSIPRGDVYGERATYGNTDYVLGHSFSIDCHGNVSMKQFEVAQ